MRTATFFRRLGRTSWRERLLLAEAIAAIGAAPAAIRLLPFRTLAARLSRFQGRQGPRAPAAFVESAAWAVRASAPFLPWRSVCFQRGLALHWMLRRRGVPTVLHYGVGQGSGKGLSAHVWVSLDGEILIGGEEAEGHACLATYPGQG